METKISSYVWPGDTHFGFGAAGLAGREATAHGGRRAFIVTDRGVAAAGLLEPVEESLKAEGVSYTIYREIPPNPDFDSVNAAAAAFRSAGADLVVGVGGGSALDAAKAIRLLVGGPPEATIDEYVLKKGGPDRKPADRRDMPPMLAIPTTAGTGSEVTPWGVLTNLERHFKQSVGGPYLVPTAALVDPALTLTLPPGLTAATGLDALSHLVEAYVSTNHNPILDPIILYGIELLGGSLRRAVAQPGDGDARSDVMLASTIGGIAISSKWLGACHALAHQLSSMANVHHGVAIALMLPHQMAFSLKGAPRRYAQIAAALDGDVPAVPQCGPERAAEAVRDLITDVGLPLRLRDAGVGREMISALADNAYLDLNWATNPCPIDRDEMAQLYEAAY